MNEGTTSQRPYWWALAGGSAVLAASIAGRMQPWLFGVLLLIAWALLSYATGLLSMTRPLRLLLVATGLALAVVTWNYTAPQPRIRVDAVQLQRLPSTVQPGAVEMVVRNSGTVAADVEAVHVAYLAPVFRTPQGLAAGTLRAELSERLQEAARTPPTTALTIPPGESARFEVVVPDSERAWFIARGEATVLVAARLRYRARLFVRERVFCHFTTPPSSQWLSCPFLND